MLFSFVVNPLKNPAAHPPKKSKAPPPLPPPKPISEEKMQKEQRNMYDMISGDEEDDDDDDYTKLTSQEPPEPEGGILRYDYADMDRGVRPVDEYGGSGGSATGTSGSGAFHSNDSASDDEYIVPLNPPPPPTMVHQKPPTRNQYINTLNGRNLSVSKPDVKSATLPHRPYSADKDKPSGRNPMSLPGSKDTSFSSSSNLSNSAGNAELLSRLNRRKKQVEGSVTDDDVFTKESPKVKSFYQVSMRILA